MKPRLFPGVALYRRVRQVEDLPLEANGDQRAEWTHRHGLGVKWLLITTDELAVMKRMHEENRKMRATLKLLQQRPNMKVTDAPAAGRSV